MSLWSPSLANCSLKAYTNNGERKHAWRNIETRSEKLEQWRAWHVLCCLAFTGLHLLVWVALFCSCSSDGLFPWLSFPNSLQRRGKQKENNAIYINPISMTFFSFLLDHMVNLKKQREPRKMIAHRNRREKNRPMYSFLRCALKCKFCCRLGWNEMGRRWFRCRRRRRTVWGGRWSRWSQWRRGRGRRRMRRHYCRFRLSFAVRKRRQRRKNKNEFKEENAWTHER